jgi:polyisoprenoid-binding protein YceI
MFKRTFFGLLVLLAFTLTSQAQKYAIDASHSAVIFGIQHMGLGNTYGRFNTFSGEILFDDKNIEKTKFTLTVKTASVDTYNAKRDKHLRNADFFDAGTYPEMKFVSTKVEKVDGKTDIFKVIGNLTILNKTKEITVEMKKVGVGTHFFTRKPAIGFETHFKISRKDFNFGKGKSAGAVGEEVSIIIALEGLVK